MILGLAQKVWFNNGPLGLTIVCSAGDVDPMNVAKAGAGPLW